MAIDPNEFKSEALRPREDALVAELMQELVKRTFPEMESTIDVNQVSGRGGDDYQYGGVRFMDFENMDQSRVTEMVATFKLKEGAQMSASEDVLLQRKAELASDVNAVFGYSQNTGRPLPEVKVEGDSVTLKLNETARMVASSVSYSEVEKLLPEIAEQMGRSGGING